MLCILVEVEIVFIDFKKLFYLNAVSFIPNQSCRNRLGWKERDGDKERDRERELERGAEGRRKRERERGNIIGGFSSSVKCYKTFFQ